MQTIPGRRGTTAHGSLPSVCYERLAHASGGQFARPSSTTAERASRCVRRRAGAPRDASSSRPLAEREDIADVDRAPGRGSAIRVPVQALRPQPVGFAAREERVRALVPGRHASAPSLCPVEHEPCSDERAGRAPHELVRLVRDVLAHPSEKVVREICARRRGETPTRRIPDSPVRSADSRSARARPDPACLKSGRAGVARASRSAMSRRDRGVVSAWPRSAEIVECPEDTRRAAVEDPSAGSSHRQRSQSSARQRSFGPRNAASASVDDLADAGADALRRPRARR